MDRKYQTNLLFKKSSKKQLSKIFASCLIIFSSPTISQINIQACAGVSGQDQNGIQPFTLAQTSTTNDNGTIRNTFETTPLDFTQSCPAGVCELRMIWNTAATRWELQLDNDGPVNNPDYTTAVMYYNTRASFPNPPDINSGDWIDGTVNAVCSDAITSLSGDVQSNLPVELQNFSVE